MDGEIRNRFVKECGTPLATPISINSFDLDGFYPVPEDEENDENIVIQSTSYQTGLSDRQKLEKLRKIKRALRRNPPDIKTLRQCSISQGGLLTDKMRKHVWPLLVGDLFVEGYPVGMAAKTPSSTDSIPDSESEDGLDEVVTEIDPHDAEWSISDELRSNWNYEQVLMDVRRLLARFPAWLNVRERHKLLGRAMRIIMRVLVDGPPDEPNVKYSYYQGFHDVCLTVLLVVHDEDISLRICRRLAAFQMRSYLTEDLAKTENLLVLMYPLVASQSRRLDRYMRQAELGTTFALEWLITWFSHSIDDMSQLSRLFDLFLATHPFMPVYLGAALILHREQDLLNVECDMPYLFVVLKQIPSELPIEDLCTLATDLFVRKPPSWVETEVKKNPVPKSKLGRLSVSLAICAISAGAFALVMYGKNGSVYWESPW